MESMSAFWVGLDWGDSSHTVHAFRPDTTTRHTFTVPNTPKGLRELATRLVELDTVGGVAVETTHGLVVQALLDAGLVVYPVNPKLSKTWRAARSVAEAKSDGGDARVLAEGLLHQREHLRPLRPGNQQACQLAALVEAEKGFIDERTAHVQQLTALLKRYHPQMLAFFDDWTTPTAWEFLLAFSTPDALATAHIVVAAAPYVTGRQRQQRLGPVQGLNLRLLIHRKHQRMVRRIHVQPHNIANLFDEERVVRQLERVLQVRLKAESMPNAHDRALRKPRTLSHQSRTPVRGILRFGLQRLRNDLFHVRVRYGARSAGPGLVYEPFQTPLPKPLPPFTHGLWRRAQLSGHLRIVHPVRTGEHNARPKRQSLRRRSAASPLGKLLPLIVAHAQGFFRASRSHRHILHSIAAGLLCEHDEIRRQLFK